MSAEDPPASRERPRRERPKPPRPERTAAQKIRHALRLLNEVAEERAAALGAPGLAPLPLTLEVGHDREGLAAQEERVARQLHARVLSQVPMSWRRGAVYCLHTRAAVYPPSPQHVFVGYDLLGRPQWRALLPLCLERGVEGVEGLYDDPPRPVALTLAGPFDERVLEGLRAGGAGGAGEEGVRYEVLAQLVVGFLTPRFELPGADDERRALSAQVLRAQRGEGDAQLRLNLLGVTEEELFDGAERLAPRGPLAQAQACVRQAQRRVQTLEGEQRRAALTAEELAARALRLVEWLRGALLQVLRPAEGRTRHAQRRHEEMERPTSHARQDAARAGDDRLLFDAHQETVVVIGPKARAHVFTEEGAHVTSLRLGVGEVERKVAQGRWRPLDPARAARLRARLS